MEQTVDLEINVGQIISIQDDMNEFESGEYKIKELYEYYKQTDKLNITELEEIGTRYDDHATWILLESVTNNSRIQCNPLSINIQVDENN